MLSTNHKEFVDRLLGCWSGWTTSCYTQRRRRNFWSPFRTFFEICLEFGLKVIALKTILFAKQATFCGRIFGEEGMACNPCNFEALRAMLLPQMASDLTQFLCGLNWIRTAIPNYAAISVPLHGILKMLQSGWWLDLKSWPNFLFLNYGSPHTQIHFTHYSEQ